ncbi:MAG: hypothetical protein EBR81_06620 [Proteobacteria bacterium]|nr:hypothetical protein [Pseudomonadota bacterium]
MSGSSYSVSFSFMDDSKDLSTWDLGAPAPQCLPELSERQSGAGAPRSEERRTSFLQDLVLFPPVGFSGYWAEADRVCSWGVGGEAFG